MSGQDILDQAAGTTPFVHDYLHITWDGTETPERQGDRQRPRGRGHACRTAWAPVPLDHSVLGGAAFEDRITPNGTRDGDLRRRQRRTRRPVVQRHVQGRVPRVPARGLRDGGAEGRPDQRDRTRSSARNGRRQQQVERKGRLRAALPLCGLRVRTQRVCVCPAPRRVRHGRSSRCLEVRPLASSHRCSMAPMIPVHAAESSACAASMSSTSNSATGRSSACRRARSRDPQVRRLGPDRRRVSTAPAWSAPRTRRRVP